MINEKRQLCKACATGNSKHAHNQDPHTCVQGRKELLRDLPADEQLRELQIHERLSPEMVEYIRGLAKSRKKTPLEIIEEEGLCLS